jgi:hypothetical protein
MTVDCVICCEEITSPGEMFKTPCGHVFHNSCLTPWLLTKTTCPLCRENYGDKDLEDESDYEYDSDMESAPLISTLYNFDVTDPAFDAVVDRIITIHEDPEMIVQDGMLNYHGQDRVYCLYSLIRDGNSIMRVDFAYNKDAKSLEVDIISHQVFNNIRKDGDRWMFKRRANGYFNTNCEFN